MKQPFILFIFLSLLFYACRKDTAQEPCTDPLNPDCVNYKPCNGTQPITADFDITVASEYDEDYQNLKAILFDSIFPPGEIRFEAVLNNAKYTWKSDRQVPKNSLKKWSYYFMNNPTPVNSSEDTSVYGEYKYTLTVVKDVNTFCYPNDIPTATLTKTFFIKRPSQLLTSGKFRVLFDGYTDSNTIQILSNSHVDIKDAGVLFDTESRDTRILVGFKDTKDDSIFVSSGYGTYFVNRVIYFDKQEQQSCKRPFNGIFKVNPNDYSIEGKYDIRNQQGTIVTHKFKGRKL